MYIFVNRPPLYQILLKNSDTVCLLECQNIESDMQKGNEWDTSNDLAKTL